MLKLKNNLLLILGLFSNFVHASAPLHQEVENIVESLDVIYNSCAGALIQLIKDQSNVDHTSKFGDSLLIREVLQEKILQNQRWHGADGTRSAWLTAVDRAARGCLD